MGITAGIGSPMAYAAETPLVINTTSVAFGNVNVGSTSAPMTTVITNTSDQNFGPLHVAGGAPASGKFGGVQSCNGATLAPGGTCTFVYTFSPTAPGSVTDTSKFVISATPNQADGETFTVSLSGCGVPQGQPCPSAPTTTMVQSSVNPSVFGQQVTFTATVDAPSTPAVPAGTVKFVDATAGTTLATVTLDSNGQATLTTAALAVGSHDIQATYTPSSAAFAGSIGSLTQVVKPPAPGGGGGDPSLAVTGSSLPTTLAWQGALIIAIGIALLMLVRSRRARTIAQALPPEEADDRS